MWTTFGVTFQEKKDNKVTSIPEFLNIAPALPWGKDTAMASNGKKMMTICFYVLQNVWVSVNFEGYKITLKAAGISFL